MGSEGVPPWSVQALHAAPDFGSVHHHPLRPINLRITRCFCEDLHHGVIEKVGIGSRDCQHDPVQRRADCCTMKEQQHLTLSRTNFAMIISDETVHKRPNEKTKIDASENDSENCDGAAERAALRKVDWHVLPMVFLLYMVSFLDR